MKPLFTWAAPAEGSVTLTANADGSLRLQVHAADPRFGVVSVIVPAAQVKPLEEALRRHLISSNTEEKA